MPASTTRMPRMTGYQTPFGDASAASVRRDSTTTPIPPVDCAAPSRSSEHGSASSPSQRSLVGHDRLDLVLGEHRAEVRHAARRDATHAVALVRLDPDADPGEELGLTGRWWELVVHVAIGEVGTVRTATHRPGRRVRLGIGGVEVRPAARVA